MAAQPFVATKCGFTCIPGWTPMQGPPGFFLSLEVLKKAFSGLLGKLPSPDEDYRHLPDLKYLFSPNIIS